MKIEIIKGGKKQDAVSGADTGNSLPGEQLVPQSPYLQDIPQEYVPGNKAQEVGRNIIRSLSGGATQVAGLPGSLVQGISSLANLGQSLVGGTPSQTLSDIPYLPTGEKLQKNITAPLLEYFGGPGYSQPQSKLESFFDDVVGDALTLSVPFGGSMSVPRILSTSGLGNIAKYGSTELGLPEPVGEGLKLGTMIGLNLAGPKRAKSAARTLRETAEKSLPEGATFSSSSFEPVIERLIKLSEKGDLPSDWKKKIEYLSNAVVKKKIPVEDVKDFVEDLNKLYYGSKSSAALKRSYPLLKKKSWDFLKNYGKKNPQFYNAYKDSVDIFRPVLEYERLSNANKGIVKNLGAGALSGGLSWILGVPPGTSTAIGGGVSAAIPKMQMLKIMNDNPSIRNVWIKQLKAAASGNINQATKLARSLDKKVNELV